MGGLALITHNADRLYMPNLLQPQEAKLCSEVATFTLNSGTKPPQEERGYKWKPLVLLAIIHFNPT